jgi:glycine cleavage system transcriptional repressor
MAGTFKGISMTARFKHAYVLNVLSNDHPGIVAAVGNAVEGMGGNIDSCSQTVLGGYFTLIMIVSFPRPIDGEKLSAQVRGTDAGLAGFQVMVRPFLPPPGEAAPELKERFVITAFGRDKPGIVMRFSQYLAGKDINIVDLYGSRQEKDFVLISEVDVPARWEIAMLQGDLEQMGKEEGFTVRLQHENVFVATNQLRLRRS